MNDTRIIDSAMLDKIKALGMPEVKENNPWFTLHIKGDDTKAPGSWNARVYRNKTGILKVVTTDMLVIDALLTNTARSAPVSAATERKSERIITVDDSGWGFVLMDVLICAHDSQTGQIITEEIKVEYFQSPYFETKVYLNQAAFATMRLLDRLNASPGGTLIKICTGYIHTETVRVLIENGYTIERGGIGETNISFKKNPYFRVNKVEHSREVKYGSADIHDFDDQWVVCLSCGAELHDRTAIEIIEAFENDLPHIKRECTECGEVS